MSARSVFLRLLLVGAALLLYASRGLGAPITVGGYLLNSEGIFTATAQTYAVPLELTAQTRLVVQAAPQYAIDFGIIPAADLKAWKRGQPARFYVRLTGQTDTRYVTLNAGSYYVVARDLNGGIVANGFAIKVRRFTGKAKEDGVKLAFVSNSVGSQAVAPGSRDGFQFTVPTNGKVWLDGVFSRGADRTVRYEILTETGYQKLLTGQPRDPVLSGASPKKLGFDFSTTPGRYYLIFFNQGPIYSSFTVTREIYR